jgi:hypothetical protein
MSQIFDIFATVAGTADTLDLAVFSHFHGPPDSVFVRLGGAAAVKHRPRHGLGADLFQFANCCAWAITPPKEFFPHWFSRRALVFSRCAGWKAGEVWYTVL